MDTLSSYEGPKNEVLISRERVAMSEHPEGTWSEATEHRAKLFLGVERSETTRERSPSVARRMDLSRGFGGYAPASRREIREQGTTKRSLVGLGVAQCSLVGVRG